MLERKIENRQLLNIISLFTIVQFAGLLVTIYALGPVEVYAGPVQPASTFSQALLYLGYIIVTAAVIIIIFKFVRGNILFVLMEGFVVLFATAFLLFIVLSTIFPNANYVYILVFSAITTIILIIAKNYRPRLRNLIAITSSIGVGVVIGLNGFSLAYILMLLIAIYDYIAVFITKHMITLAKSVSEKNLAFLIGSSDIEAIPEKYVTKKDKAEFAKAVKVSEVKDPVIRDLIEKGIIPVVSQVQLGTGDLAIPLMLTVSAYITFLNFTVPVLIIIGSILGLVFTMYLLKRYKVALPAIPPLFAFINLFLAIAFLLVKTPESRLWPEFLAVSFATIVILMIKLNQLTQTDSRKLQVHPSA